MKKALVIALMLMLGLGLAAFGSSIEGSWSFGTSFNPGAVEFADFIIDFDSTLSLSYLFGGWTFSSTTGFDGLGYASQKFTAGGVLGAFSFTSKMTFLPRAITASAVTHDFGGNYYEDTAAVPFTLVVDPVTGVITDTITTVDTVGVAFDEWISEVEVSIAGVKFSGLFGMKDFAGTTTSVTNDIYDYEWIIVAGVPAAGDLIDITPVVAPPGIGSHIMVQTDTYTVVDATGLVNTGAGWRFIIEGSIGDVTLKSYTYFNLKEGFATVGFGRTGVFTIDRNLMQDMWFTSQYFVIEGLSLGCIEADAALLITCANGFERFSLRFTDIYLLCCGISTDFQIDFGLETKTVSLTPSITVDSTCWIPTLSLNWTDETITGISLDALEVEVVLNGLTFSSKTAWNGSMGKVDSGNTEDWFFIVPAVGLGPAIPAVDANGQGLYIIESLSFANDYFEIFESFTIEYESDSCCGGALSVEIETQFGNRFTETLAEWGYWYETNVNAAGVAGAAADHGQGLYYDVFATNGGVAPALWTCGPGVLPLVPWTWYPGCGINPVLPADAAYAQLIGAGPLPPVVYVAGTAAEAIFSGSSTLKTAVAGGTLFGWAQTTIDVGVGIGSNLSLTFGLEVGAYGWTEASLGFEVTF